MLHSRFRLAAAALVGSASVAGIFAVAGPAQAFVGIKCSTLSGNVNTTFTLSGCNGNTGGSSQPIANLAGGGTVTWLNGKTTTFAKPTITGETDSTETKKCPAGTAETEVKGAVTADTTLSAPVPGTYKLEVCLNGGTGAANNEPGSKIKIG